MDSSTSHSISSSLLVGVRRQDPVAWRRFATIYTPLVYGWARRAGLQESDAADVVQDVFRTVYAKIDDFREKGRFQGWLWAITRNRVRLIFRQAQGRAMSRGGSSALQALQQMPDFLGSDLEPTGDGERRALVRRTLEVIRNDFADQTWTAFWQVAMMGRPTNDVADELALSPQAVRQAKYRVLCRLRNELSELA